MASVGVTLCSAGIIPPKMKKKKSVGEMCKYLTENRLEGTQFWRRVGGVLVFNEEALEQVEKRRNAGQRQQQGVAVGCCRCGSTHPSRVKRGGDRIARRDRQRANRDRSRDDRELSRILAQTLSPLQGGSVSRIAERPSKLQLLQQFAVAGFAEGEKIRSKKDQAIYVGITSPTNRLAMKDDGDGAEEERAEK